MQGETPTSSGTVEAFRKQIRMASARYRLERLSGLSLKVAWGLVGALLVLIVLALLTPIALWAVSIGLALIALALVALIVIYQRTVPRHRLLVRMDRHAKLPDSALSAGDWENAEMDPWRERQRIELVRAMETVDWRKAWAVQWPRLLWVPVTGSLVLLLLLGVAQHNWLARTYAERVAAQQALAPVAPEKLKPLAEIFQDWDNAEKIAPSPELEELLKEIKPMRAQMASGQMTEKEMFLKLNEVQARLQAAQDRLEASSLEPMAQSMAEALKNLDGMSGLASALQRKDFAAAREQAAQAQEKYNSGAAKMPEGANAQTAANRLGELAQQASKNNSQAANAMQQMKESISKKDSSGMCKSLGSLKDSLGQQSQKQGQSHSLGLQMSQLSNCKNGMCNNPGIKAGMPQISLTKSLEPGKGAGSAVDPNRAGAPTQIDASHQDMKLTGTAGDGASETQTESTMDPHFEKTAASVNASQFSAYEKLSEQATEDENLPVADRQMIKRYFEDIRPQGNP